MTRHRGVILVMCVAVVPVSGIAVADHRLGNNGHWEKNQHDSRAHVTQVDDTDGRFPVGTAAFTWSLGQNRLDVFYAGGASGCGHHCVRNDVVGEAEVPQFGQFCSIGGMTTASNENIGGSNHFREAVTVHYNRACVAGAEFDDLGDSARLALACHEQGHSIGLKHRNTRDPESCMVSPLAPGKRSPDDHDFGEVENIYDHGS